jgi:hypothetical protein
MTAIMCDGHACLALINKNLNRDQFIHILHASIFKSKFFTLKPDVDDTIENRIDCFRCNISPEYIDEALTLLNQRNIKRADPSS